MRDKLVRSIAFALLAAVTVGVAPSFANTSSDSEQTLIADGMLQQKQMRRVYKRTAAKKQVSRAAAPAIRERVIERIIEKPVIIEKEVQVQVPAPAVEQTVVQPAVVEAATPVVIDRYEKRRRSLIHLGLFPINLLGE
jgi:hypothetical protein